MRREILPRWQTRSGLEHALLDCGRHPVSDLVGQAYPCRAVQGQIQRSAHRFVVHDFFGFLVLFSGPFGGIFMTKENPMKIPAPLAALVAALALAGPAAAHDGQAGTVEPKFDQAIANIPGKSLIVVEVDYAPGAASPSHTHAPSAFIYAYVLSGEIESKVNDEEARVYKAGEGWHETPNARHQISRNASATKPAKLLAVFIVDSGDKPLTTSVQ
jgi:quercetin dioxygenase-like cupin family protein